LTVNQRVASSIQAGEQIKTELLFLSFNFQTLLYLKLIWTIFVQTNRFLIFGQILSLMKYPNAKFSIGEYIRSLRFKQKLSLSAVSNQTGIDTSLLGKIERDKRQPTAEQIKQLSIFYKVDENLLKRQNLIDQLAYQVIDANADIEILRVAEQKIEYLTKRKK
jgi:transcriptional regulator with XRE-family HTH domain